MKTYKYVDETKLVVHIIDEDGKSRSSCLASDLEEGTVILLADSLTVEQRVAEVKVEAQRIIFAKWPIWAQQNCADGTYPPSDLDQMCADKALVLTECTRLVAAIEAGQVATPNWPII